MKLSNLPDLHTLGFPSGHSYVNLALKNSTTCAGLSIRQLCSQKSRRLHVFASRKAVASFMQTTVYSQGPPMRARLSSYLGSTVFFLLLTNDLVTFVVKAGQDIPLACTCASKRVNARYRDRFMLPAGVYFEFERACAAGIILLRNTLRKSDIQREREIRPMVRVTASFAIARCYIIVESFLCEFSTLSLCLSHWRPRDFILTFHQLTVNRWVAQDGGLLSI